MKNSIITIRSNLLSPDQTFAIDSVVHGKVFNHSLYVTQRCKDAIVDRFRKDHGRRPTIDTRHPDIRLHLHIFDQKCSLSLDTSGHSLHHRGYRSLTNIAPINEVLAAGIIMLSDWDQRTDFMDPMCGSGNPLIEAAMMACKIPANLNRNVFAFEKWKDWDNILFDKIKIPNSIASFLLPEKSMVLIKLRLPWKKQPPTLKMPGLRILYKSIGQFF